VTNRAFESQVVLVVLLYQSLNSIFPKSPAVTDRGISLTNLSLGLNDDEGFFYTEPGGYRSFTPNRE
jgi:hypothetical protein